MAMGCRFKKVVSSGEISWGGTVGFAAAWKPSMGSGPGPERKPDLVEPPREGAFAAAVPRAAAVELADAAFLLDLKANPVYHSTKRMIVIRAIRPPTTGHVFADIHALISFASFPRSVATPVAAFVVAVKEDNGFDIPLVSRKILRNELAA